MTVDLVTAAGPACLLPHQQAALEPAQRILQRHHGVLVTWPLGTGKTWLACALARSAGLEARVVAPARLLPMWRRVDAALEAGVCDFVSHRAASLDALPRPASPARALWIVDEAHAFRNAATRRHRALALAVAAGRVCLLTATPFNTELADLETLLGLFGALPDGAALTDALGRVTLPWPRATVQVEVARRTLRCAPCDASARGAWREVVEAIVTAPWPVFAPDLAPEIARGLLCDALLGRLLAHPIALQQSLRRLQRYYLGCHTPSGELLDRDAFARLFGRHGPLQGRLPFAWDVGLCSPALLDLRDDVLTAIHRAQRALTVVLDTRDPRLDALDAVLRETVGAPDRRWGHRAERTAVLFTGSTDVAHHVAAALGQRGWAVGLVTGSRAERCGLPLAADTLLATLDPDVGADPAASCQVLVCTDVLGQGHNLQRASTLVHLDRPWNPVRLDQREGRLVRHGQRAGRVELLTLRPEPGHDALADLVARLDRALSTRRREAARVQGVGFVPFDPAHLPGARAGPETAALLGRLMSRVRPVRRHPRAREWLGRVGALRRRLCARTLPTGVHLTLEALAEAPLDADVERALDRVEAALAPVLG